LENKLLAELLGFRGNELVTVRISAFCGAILSNNSAVKVSNFFGIYNKANGLFFVCFVCPTLTAVEVILVLAVIPEGFRLSKRLGSL